MERRMVYKLEKDLHRIINRYDDINHLTWAYTNGMVTLADALQIIADKIRDEGLKTD